jgi:hypothetical protein
MVKNFMVSEFRPKTRGVVLNYDYCILCGDKVVDSLASSRLEQHHIFFFSKDSDHNSVHNVVLLCSLHHKYFAHSGHWGYSLATSHPLRDIHYSNDEYDCIKMLGVVVMAGRLWNCNPYNHVGDKWKPLPKCYAEIRRIYISGLAKLARRGGKNGCCC